MIVLDASAVVDVVLGLGNRAWVLAHLSEEEMLAPPHQMVEVMAAVARLERAGVLTAEDAARAVADAVSLPQEVRPLTPALVRRAFALRSSLRVAEACYVALAEATDADLVTTDAGLVRVDPPCRVVHPFAT